MRVLGLDTTTGTGGAALVANGLVGEYVLGVGAEHSEQLLPSVARILHDAGWQGRDLDGIAVAVGPGSFTGLRIGVTTAKALAYAWHKPVVGVSTLEALAWQVVGFSGLVAPALNARRGLVFAAVYRVETGCAALPEALLPPSNLLMTNLLDWLANRNERVCILGDGAALFTAQIAEQLGEMHVRLPETHTALRPSSVASLGAFRLMLGEFSDAYTLLPAYIRKPEAETKWEKAHQS